MDVKKIFGNNLHIYRKKQGISQEKLSETLDISTKHLSDLETGKSFVSAELLENISQVLHISPSALFFTPDEMSVDESDWSKIEEIITQEVQKMMVSTKLRISEISCAYVQIFRLPVCPFEVVRHGPEAVITFNQICRKCLVTSLVTIESHELPEASAFDYIVCLKGVFQEFCRGLPFHEFALNLIAYAEFRLHVYLIEELFDHSLCETVDGGYV